MSIGELIRKFARTAECAYKAGRCLSNQLDFMAIYVSDIRSMCFFGVNIVLAGGRAMVASMSKVDFTLVATFERPLIMALCIAGIGRKMEVSSHCTVSRVIYNW